MANENFEIIKRKDETIIFHGLTGTVIVLDAKAQVDYVVLEQYVKDKVKIKSNQKCEKSARLRHLIFNVSEICNMKCKYCYAGAGEYGTRGILMKQEVAEQALQYIYGYYKEGVERISFFGGEPLLSMQLIRDIVARVEIICKENHLSIPEFDFISNGTLMTEENIVFFNQYIKNLTISIDGPKSLQDAVRVMKDDSGSFDIVCRGVKRLKEQTQIVVNAAMVLNRYHIEAYKRGEGDLTAWKNELYQLGFDYISYGIVQTTQEELMISDQETFLEMIKKDVRYEMELLLKGEGVLSHKYYQVLYRIITKTYSQECNCGIRQIFVTATGEYYPCQYFYNQRMDTIAKNGILDEEKREFVQKHYIRQNVEKCKACALNKVCTMWCPGIALRSDGMLQGASDIACSLEYTIFREVLSSLVTIMKNPENYKKLLMNLKVYITRIGIDFGKEEH